MLGFQTVHVYFGTYTRYGTSEGVYVYDLDPGTSALTRLQVVAGPHDPTYLALDPTEAAHNGFSACL